ncbi:MAG: LCP family protein [Clostridia bacterium]|nr:LCP family protein [Clostridia bacterium]
MFYERPKKKIRRAPETDRDAGREEQTYKRKRVFFLARRDYGYEEEEAQRRDEPESRKRFSILRFLFETPRKADAPEADEMEGYVSEAREHVPVRRKKHYLLRFIAALIALTAAFAYLLYLLPAGFFGFHNTDQFSADHELPSGYTHVLLIGTDRDAGGTSRSDTMMIASIAKGDIKLTSLMRDTGVSIPGRSGVKRLNAAYAYGGAELLIKAVNENYALNVTRYVLVDYESFPKLIDMIGGLDMDITQAEMEQINNNTREVLYRRVLDGKTSYDEGLKEYESALLYKYGEDTHLSGIQALSYARIRNLDSDYGRTQRQRKLLSEAVSKMKSFVYRPVALIGIGTSALNELETNMNVLEIISLGLKAATAGGVEQMRLPVNGTYTDDGGMFYNVDYKKNHDAFVEFVYGGE